MTKSPYRVKSDGPDRWFVMDERSGQKLKWFSGRAKARAFKAELDGRVAAALKSEQPQHADTQARR